jgi:hypothetical protein
MQLADILVPSRNGICCKLGGFYIDPTRPVDKAVITHAHSDHARAGHGAVLATQETLDLMRLRYGDNFAGSCQAIRYNESVSLDGAKVTFYPAGHVLGSAQIARWRNSRATTKAAASRWERSGLPAMPTRQRSPGPSRFVRRQASRKYGRGAFPIRSLALPRDGCGCARGHASIWSSCRW